MALKVGGTEVISDARALSNITNLKTINGNSVLGTGDITIAAGSTNNISINQFTTKGTGKLLKIGDVSNSNFPYSTAIHPNGKFVYVTNDYSKTISIFSINETSGALTSVSSILVDQPVKQIIVHKSGNMLYVATQSKPLCYSINSSTGALNAADNSGHPFNWCDGLAFNSTHTRLYAVGGLSATNIVVYSINPNTYALTQISTVPFNDLVGTHNVAIDSSDNFLYISSYNSNKTSVFNVSNDSATFIESYFTGSATSPYNICLHPTGDFLYVSCANVKKIVIYRVNRVDGRLTQLAEQSAVSSGRVCIDPSGNYLYNSGDVANIEVFAVNVVTGLLTSIESVSAPATFISSLRINGSGNILFATHGHANKVVSYAVNNASFGSLDVQGNLTVGQKINDLNFGFGSGNVNTNTVIGKSAFVSNGTDGWAPGVGNTAIGHETLLSNTAGGCNTGIGADALRSNTNSSHNTSIGWYAMRNLSTGSPNNTAVGSQSMQALSSGTGNTAIGQSSMTSAVSGSGNTAVGYKSLSWTNSGSSNTCVGSDAMSQNTTGFDNTCIGTVALLRNTTGSRNVGLGYGALAFNTSGSGNVSIGPTTAAGTISPVFNATTENNRISMGSTAVTNAYVQVAWTVVSDARDKTNFAPVPHGLDFVKKLKPVAYQFKVSRDDDTPHGNVKYGFKAQDVLELEGDNPVIVDNEVPEKLKMVDQHLIAVMVKAIQEQTVLIESLRSELDYVKQRLKDTQ